MKYVDDTEEGLWREYHPRQPTGWLNSRASTWLRQDGRPACTCHSDAATGEMIHNQVHQTGAGVEYQGL